MFTNPWEVQCCASGSTNSNCKAGGNIKCSGQLGSDKNEFFSMCPKMDKQNCGYSKNY